MHTCRYHLHNLANEADPLYYLSTHEEEIKLSLGNSVESRWRELKIKIRLDGEALWRKREVTICRHYGEGFNEALDWIKEIMMELEKK